MLIRQINNGSFQVLDDKRLYKLYNCLQELQLWKTENPFDIEAGIDYFGIFSNRVFIEPELKRVIDKHKGSYNSYEIENITYDNDILRVSIIFNIDSEISYRFNLHIQGSYNG